MVVVVRLEGERPHILCTCSVDGGGAVTLRGLVDTGATHSAMSRCLLAEMRAPFAGVVCLETAHGTNWTKTYEIVIRPYEYRPLVRRVTALESRGPDLILGNDVLSRFELNLRLGRGYFVFEPPRRKKRPRSLS